MAMIRILPDKQNRFTLFLRNFASSFYIYVLPDEELKKKMENDIAQYCLEDGVDLKSIFLKKKSYDYVAGDVKIVSDPKLGDIAQRIKPVWIPDSSFLLVLKDFSQLTTEDASKLNLLVSFFTSSAFDMNKQGTFELPESSSLRAIILHKDLENIKMLNSRLSGNTQYMMRFMACNLKDDGSWGCDSVE